MQVNANEEERQFDSYVDSLGHSDLFGKTGSESQQELDRRRDLHVAARAQLIGLERLGRPAELNSKLIDRVANMASVDQVVVLDFKIGTLGHWLEMLGMKVADAMHPLFPLQAVDAAKIKLISQPLSVLHCGRISLRAMTTAMGVGRVLKGIRPGHRCDFF